MSSVDLVVVIPGIMGSTLGVARDGEPAAARLIWAPTAGAVWNNLTGRARVTDFALPDGIGDSEPDDGVQPVGLMPDLHVLPGVWTPIKGYDVTMRHLEKQVGLRPYLRDDPTPGQLMAFPYDWRLSNRVNARRLKETVEPALARLRSRGGQYRDAQLVLVCHSMGGLVARWYLQMLGGAEVTRKLITIGTPWRGSTEAVLKLVNGAAPALGRFQQPLLAFGRSLPSLYQLVPEFALIAYGADFRKTTETDVPELETVRLADSMAFYTDLLGSERADAGVRDRSHLLVGTRQPTWTTLTVDADRRLVPSRAFGAQEEYGDGTVPLSGGLGLDLAPDTGGIVRVRDNHGNLQRNPLVLDQIEEVVTASPVRRRSTAPVRIGVEVPELVLQGDPLRVLVQTEGGERAALRVRVLAEPGATGAARLLYASQADVVDGEARVEIGELPAGAHTVVVDSPPMPGQPSTPGANLAGRVEPVTAATLVWPQETPEVT